MQIYIIYIYIPPPPLFLDGDNARPIPLNTYFARAKKTKRYLQMQIALFQTISLFTAKTPQEILTYLENKNENDRKLIINNIIKINVLRAQLKILMVKP